MGLKIEFTGTPNVSLEKLKIERLGCSIFLPKESPLASERLMCEVYLEMHIAGMPPGKLEKIGLEIQKLFSDENVRITQDEDCSDMFVEKTDVQSIYARLVSQADASTSASLQMFPNGERNVPCLRLARYQKSTDVVPVQPVVMREVHTFRILAVDGDNKTDLIDRTEDAPEHVLGLWVHWKEELPHIDDSYKVVHTFPVEFQYEGVQARESSSPVESGDRGNKPLSQKANARTVEVERLEIVITLPMWSVDASDDKPLDGAMPGAFVSDWLEKRGKGNGVVFKRWQEHEPGKRRFIFWSLIGNALTSSLVGKRVQAIVYDRDGDRQRTADLAGAGVLFGATVGRVSTAVADSWSMLTVWPPSKPDLRDNNWVWVTLAVALLGGASYLRHKRVRDQRLGWFGTVGMIAATVIGLVVLLTGVVWLDSRLLAAFAVAMLVAAFFYIPRRVHGRDWRLVSEKWDRFQAFVNLTTPVWFPTFLVFLAMSFAAGYHLSAMAKAERKDKTTPGAPVSSAVPPVAPSSAAPVTKPVGPHPTGLATAGAP